MHAFCSKKCNSNSVDCEQRLTDELLIRYTHSTLGLEISDPNDQTSAFTVRFHRLIGCEFRASKTRFVIKHKRILSAGVPSIGINGGQQIVSTSVLKPDRTKLSAARYAHATLRNQRARSLAKCLEVVMDDKGRQRTDALICA